MSAAELRETVLAPEGVELRFATAGAAERAIALVFDLCVMLLAVLLGGLVIGGFLGLGGVILLLFFLRHGYFLFFEARSNGQTIGKRRFHLRVIRADGGPLTTEILLARNLTREVELFLPLTLLFVPDVLFAEHGGTVRLVASLWILLFLFFPLLNSRRLRIGDLLAGTRVVISPPMPLLRDLAYRAQPGRKLVDGQAGVAAATEPEFRFTKAQLEIYGEHELQVLEDLLRKRRAGNAGEAFAAVTKSICRRIGYDLESIGHRHEAFLRAFYGEQRQHLEQRLALGRRRRRKKQRDERSGPR